MKKVFMSAVLALVLLIGENSAYATPVQIYDSDFDEMLPRFKFTCQFLGVDVWGTEYYTYQGARRCELHFGDSTSNIIRFRLNNDNSVSRILITTPYKYFDNNDEKVLYVLANILKEIGLSQSEIETLSNDLVNKMEQLERVNPYTTHVHEKFSVWCSKTQRYITLDLEVDYSKVDFYFYSSI